jgi:hypothetical protein
MRENLAGVNPDKFIYDGSDEVFSTDINRVLNIQYGDGNFVAPFKHSSVRGMGVDLFAPVEAMNRLQCQTVQHTLESLQMLFKIQDPADKARLRQFVLEQFGYVPEGLTIVPKNERHQIDPNLVQMSMGLIRQNMQESSSGYVQNVNDGTEKEMTAFEAKARLNQANVMVSGMLQSIDLQQGFYWQEIVRRFCDETSDDADVKKFQTQCIKDGIPTDLLYDFDNWKVTTNKVLGGGDKTLAQAQASWLFQNRTAYSPQSQQKILRMTTVTMLDDPAKGVDLVPDAPNTATAGVLAAESVFGTLMTGNQVQLRPGIDEQGYIETLLKFMQEVITKISSTDNVGTMDDLIGLQNTALNISEHIKILGADKTEQQRVKVYGDMLGKLANKIKEFSQRLQESQKAGKPKESISIAYDKAPPDIQRQIEQSAGFIPSKLPPEQGDPKLAKAAQGMKIKQAQFDQKSRHADINFEMEQIRKNTEAVSNLTQQEQFNRQELAHAAVQKLQEILLGAKKPNSESDESVE